MSRAARALSYTPSAISQQIALLEREIGLAVLKRNGRKLELTAAGRLLVEEAEVVMARLDTLEQKLQASSGIDERQMRIGAFLTASATIVPHIIQAFRTRFPDVSLALAEGDPEECLPKLRRGELDVALSLEYDFVAPLPMDGLDRVLLFNDPMHVALPAAHPLAAQRSLVLEQLASDPWITELRNSSTYPFTVRACNHAGFDPNVAFEAGDYDVVQGLVAVGVGVGFLPGLSLGTLAHGVVALPLDGTAPGRRVFCVYRSGSDASLLIAEMSNIMRDVSQQFRAANREETPGRVRPTALSRRR